MSPSVLGSQLHSAKSGLGFRWCALLTTAALGLSACATSPSTEQFTPLATAPISSCPIQPGAGNTGAAGTRTALSDTQVRDGAVIQDADVSSLDIRGNDVTVRNVSVNGHILVTGDRVVLDHVTAKGIAVSSASDVTIRYANIGSGDEDGIHITSDGGRLVRNVVLEYNYIHDPAVPATAHYDGTQIRGAQNVVIRCSTYDPGPYQDTFNAAIYLENANGGDSHVTIQDNWLRGFGFTFMIDAKDTTITGNVLGGLPRWGTCYPGRDMALAAVVATGNVSESTGSPVAVCTSR